VFDMMKKLRIEVEKTVPKNEMPAEAAQPTAPPAASGPPGVD
jgi:hypothetical protein